MSDYDRFANARVGAGLGSRAGAVDEGLRTYMLGVYNYMALGLGVTGLVAWAAFVLADVHFAGGHAVSASPFGQAIYFSALRWVIVLSPLAPNWRRDMARPREHADPFRATRLQREPSPALRAIPGAHGC